jgi:hypothetical protein
MTLNLIDSKKGAIVVHELFDLAPVAETPKFQAVQQVNLVKYSP